MKTSAKKFLNTAGPIVASALLATAVGCAQKPPSSTAPVAMDPQATDLAIVDAIRDTDVRTAIVTEHTLFPYHFVADSESLNALGRADMAVLLEHYRSEKGTLNVRHGDVSDELYASRVKRVQEVLAANGIAAGQVEISDGLPGGDGMNAYDVARAMTRSRSQASMQGNTNNSSDAPKQADSGSSSGAGSDSSMRNRAGASNATCIRGILPRIVLIACLALCVFVTGCASHAAPTAAPSTMNQNSDGSPKPALDFDAGTKRPPTAMTIYALAQIVAAQGRDNDAEGLLKQCVAQYPDFLPAYCDLAELNLRQRRGEDAVRVLTLGLKRDPNSATMLNDLGMCRLLAARYSEALVSFTKASGLVPGGHRYRANMATALGMLGRYDESLALYLAILAPADAHYNVGVLCDARHDSARAKLEYAQADTLESLNKPSPSEQVHSGNTE